MPPSKPQIRLRKARTADLSFIRAKAKPWRLDDERLRAGQFLIAQDASGRPIGFGRIKRYPSCRELGTVGVAPAWRGRGVGRRIVEALIDRFPVEDVWITTDLVSYFKTFGFRLRKRGPKELEEKIESVCRVKGRKGVKIMLLRKRRGA